MKGLLIVIMQQRIVTCLRITPLLCRICLTSASCTPALRDARATSPYAPCTLEGLLSKNYDYWALGHVHRREILHENPWIVFPGNTQGRHINESGPRGCTLFLQVIQVTTKLGKVPDEVCHR